MAEPREHITQETEHRTGVTNIAGRWSVIHTTITRIAPFQDRAEAEAFAAELRTTEGIE